MAFDGINVWVTNFFSRNVMKLRPSDGALLGTFSVGDGAAGIAYDGTYISVVNNGSNTVTKLRPSDGAVLATLSTGRSPFGVALVVTQTGTNVWVTNFGTDTVSKL